MPNAKPVPSDDFRLHLIITETKEKAWVAVYFVRKYTAAKFAASGELNYAPHS